MKIKKLLAGMLAGVLACGMLLTTGCGTTDENAVFATMGDTQVTYGVANFFTRFQQAVYDGYYNTDSTKDFWTQDMYGLGYTLEDMIKSNTLSSIEEYYRLDAHAADYDVALTDEQSAAIDEAAQSFMDSNTQEALEQIGATSVDVVKEMMRSLMRRIFLRSRWNPVRRKHTAMYHFRMIQTMMMQKKKQKVMHRRF
jgi:hypothetical protein